MSRRIEDQLRAALAAKARTVTDADLQPPLLPQDGPRSMRSRRARRLLLWSAPAFAAAAVAGLAVAGVLTPNHHSAAPSVPAVNTPTTGPQPTRPARSPGSTPATPATTPGSPATQLTIPAGGPVPAGFEPASVTFVSPTFGYVLGEPPSCASPPCTSLLRTTDRGAHWVGVPAPRTSLGDPRSMTLGLPSTSSVSTVRFADPYNGWAYGPGLWVTHDGARTWHSVDVGGQVLALETGGGRVDAIVASCEGRASCGGGPTRLLSSPVSSDDFSQVAVKPAVSANGGWYGNPAITLHPPAGFALLGAMGTPPTTPAVIVGTGGAAWSSFADPCRAVSNSSLSSFVAPDATSLLSLCTSSPAAGSTGKTVVFTRNGKSTPLGNPPRAGDGGVIAANGISTILVASTSGDDFLYRSTDSGRTWTTVQFHDGGTGLTDLGFTTPSQAVVIRGKHPAASGNQPSELLMTTDAGATWHHVNF